MIKNKKVNPSLSAVSAGIIGQGEFPYSAKHLGINCKRDDYHRLLPFILFALAVKKKEEEEEESEEEKTVKKFTVREIASLKSKTKASAKALMDVPYTPVNISPAPALAKKNTVKLCSYVSNVLICVDAIMQYSICNPPTKFCQDILNQLIPLANTPTKDLNSAEKITLANLDANLRTSFSTMIISCSTLSNGNLALFALTTVATKGKPTKHDKKLPATVFVLNSTYGKGVIGISCKRIPYSVNYTVYYGPGTVYDPATWKSQNESARQKITGLSPGILYGFVIVANGKSEQGFWVETQSRNAPFN